MDHHEAVPGVASVDNSAVRSGNWHGRAWAIFCNNMAAMCWAGRAIRLALTIWCGAARREGGQRQRA
jgi:hypothetical protein